MTQNNVRCISLWDNSSGRVVQSARFRGFPSFSVVTGVINKRTQRASKNIIEESIRSSSLIKDRRFLVFPKMLDDRNHIQPPLNLL
jgi:hypothetical protein